MRKFRRKSGAAVTHLSAYEVELLSSLVTQLVEMISDGEPEAYAPPTSDDPFELWAQDLASDPDQPEAARGPRPAAACSRTPTLTTPPPPRTSAGSPSAS